MYVCMYVCMRVSVSVCIYIITYNTTCIIVYIYIHMLSYVHVYAGRPNTERVGVHIFAETHHAMLWTAG